MITPLEKLQEKLLKNPPAGGLDALLISSVHNIIYFTNFPGFATDEREAFLLICKDKQYFITDARSSGTVRNNVKDFELAEIAAYSPFQSILKKLAKKHKVKILGIEEKNLTVSEFKTLSKSFTTKNFDTDDLRAVKTPVEINKIEKTCQLGDKTFDYILKKIKKGVSEKELAIKIELFIKKNNADVSFATIVAFGKNSAIPHHVPTHNSKLLAPNSIVLLDFGVKLDGYCSDMTRTVFFGKATAEQRKMYKTVLDAQTRAIELFNTKYSIHNTIKASTIDKAARDYIISKGYPTIPHSLGHGIGIQIHESPRLSPKSKDILKEGMVFSIEPGIYIPDFGGVRIEDLVVLTKSGSKLLTHSPKTIIEL